jgi:hypothetical protein
MSNNFIDVKEGGIKMITFLIIINFTSIRPYSLFELAAGMKSVNGAN